MAFSSEAASLRETGKLAEAAALARAHLAEKDISLWTRNIAIDILVSAGAYETALGAEPSPRMPTNTRDALSLAVIQINLAEAEYNLGRWSAAEERLRHLDLACWLFPIARAGLLQQRAWIAAHAGRAGEAVELCALVNPRWLPPDYQAECHFTRAAAFLGVDCIDDAEAALSEGEQMATRLSSKRNALFMRARIVAARGDWVGTERLCREAASHAFQGQGGSGLLLWAQALRRLGHQAEATEALRLVSIRDPESEAAVAAAELLRSAKAVSDVREEQAGS